MAQVTERIIDVGEGTITVDVTFDDVTLALVRVTATNNGTQPAIFHVRRSRSRGTWHEATLDGGASTTFNAGGPVRSMDDLGSWSLAVVE